MEQTEVDMWPLQLESLKDAVLLPTRRSRHVLSGHSHGHGRSASMRSLVQQPVSVTALSYHSASELPGPSSTSVTTVQTSTNTNTYTNTDAKTNVSTNSALMQFSSSAGGSTQQPWSFSSQLVQPWTGGRAPARSYGGSNLVLELPSSSADSAASPYGDRMSPRYMHHMASWIAINDLLECKVPSKSRSRSISDRSAAVQPSLLSVTMLDIDGRRSYDMTASRSVRNSPLRTRSSTATTPKASI